MDMDNGMDLGRDPPSMSAPAGGQEEVIKLLMALLGKGNGSDGLAALLGGMGNKRGTLGGDPPANAGDMMRDQRGAAGPISGGGAPDATNNGFVSPMVGGMNRPMLPRGGNAGGGFQFGPQGAGGGLSLGDMARTRGGR